MNLFRKFYRFGMGDADKFALEHRVLNWTLIFISSTCALALVLNLFIHVAFCHQLALSVVAICLIALFWASRFKGKQKISLWSLIVFSFFLIPVGFITNNGIEGGFQYFILVAAVLAMVLVPSSRRPVLLIFYFFEIGVCVWFQYNYPQYIIGYPDIPSRYMDAVVSIYLALIILVAVVTHVKNEYDKEKSMAQANLERANTLAKNNEYFVKIFAHDIKNCLQSNMILLGLLSRERPDEENVAALIDSNRHISRMVLNMTNVASFETIEIQKGPVLIRDVFSILVKVWQPKFTQKQISFNCKLLDDAQVYLDQKYMELVWDNLFANAYQHTPNGGIFRLQAFESDSDFSFSFVNSGKIVEKEDRENLFDKFYFPKEHSVYSKGLGLHCASLLIKKHFGSIIYRISHDGLNEFVVSIPKAI